MLLLIAADLAGCGPATNRTGEAFTATGELVALSGGEAGAANACFTCHGQQGQGDGVSAPRLAGLDVGYLQKQLDDYAADVRHDDVMTAIAKRLDHGDRRAVAAYYAAMPAPAPRAAVGPALKVYLVGDASRGLIACSTCHGPAGQGIGPGNPALAAQPRAYTFEQLRRWRASERRNDPRGVMSQAVARLTEAEMHAIAAWLETLPASPRPDSDAASVSAAESAAAGLAASRGTRRPGR